MSWRALSGLRAWIMQRASAIYITLCLLTLLGGVSAHGAITFEIWRAWFAHPVINVAAVLFFAALSVHAWVGIRNVIIDYAHVTALRLLLVAVVATTLLAVFAWALRILLALPNP